MKHFISLLAILCVLQSCQSSKTLSVQRLIQKSNCNIQNQYIYTKVDIPQPLETLNIDEDLAKSFSTKSLNVANAIGVLNTLEEYRTALVSNDSSINSRLKILELSHYIYQKIDLSSLEISAIASEIGCEEERIEQISSYFEGQVNKTETKLTVGAIALGATGAILTGILLGKGRYSEYIGIITGVSEAAFGAAILLNKRSTEFYHPRNILRDIWFPSETSEMLPASIWYYLRDRDPATNKSLRQQIKDKWMSFGDLKDDDIYFGTGGKYTLDQLNQRAEMYDQLESYITLMKQDLKALSVEIDTLKRKKRIP